jgi:DNA-binding NarL/FixJ family response regulator
MVTPSVLVFTEQPVLAEGLRCVLGLESPFELLATCTEPDELIETLRRRQPDIAVLDSTSIPGPQFLSGARAACQPCRLVLWAGEVNVKTVRHAFDLGMSGVLSNRSAPEALLAALGRIARGELYFPDVYCTPGELASSSMSPREKQLTALIAQGLKNKEIATAMELQEGTVKVYLSRLYRRLHVADRFELALLGLQAFFGNWSGAAEGQGGNGADDRPGRHAGKSTLAGSTASRTAMYPPVANTVRR